MKECDITEVFMSAVEEKIGKEWRHEVGILGCSSVHVNFEVDGREYVLRLYEVKDGRHWSEMCDDGGEG